MFNMNIFACFSAVYLKYNIASIIADINSLYILILGSFLFISTILIFYLDPDPFDYFRYSFKKVTLAMSYYFIYIPSILSSCLLIILVQVVWAPLIPISCLLLFTILYQPYNQKKQNIRCIINLIIILLFLGHRVFVKFYYGMQATVNIPGTFSFIWLFIIVVLLFVVNTASCIYLIYYFVYSCIQKNKEKQKD